MATWNAKKPCGVVGCPELVPIGQFYCAAHQKQTAKVVDARRGNSSQRGYSNARWKRLRHKQLSLEPLCRECAKAGKAIPARAVDHVVPHNGDYELMWSMDNLQSLCLSCHAKKTASEDGGFGNRRV